jgi:hypothetical protein
LKGLYFIRRPLRSSSATGRCRRIIIIIICSLYDRERESSIASLDSSSMPILVLLISYLLLIRLISTVDILHYLFTLLIFHVFSCRNFMIPARSDYSSALSLLSFAASLKLITILDSSRLIFELLLVYLHYNLLQS